MVKTFFSKNVCFFIFFKDKSRTCEKWCKVLIYVLFYISSTENYQFSRFLPDVFSLGKIQDDDQIWWRHRPLAAPHNIYLILRIKSFALKVPRRGVWICVYVRPRFNPLNKMKSPSLGWQFKSLSKDQFNKTFTSVFYKNNHCFSVWKP